MEGTTSTRPGMPDVPKTESIGILWMVFGLFFSVVGYLLLESDIQAVVLVGLGCVLAASVFWLGGIVKWSVGSRLDELRTQNKRILEMLRDGSNGQEENRLGIS